MSERGEIVRPGEGSPRHTPKVTNLGPVKQFEKDSPEGRAALAEACVDAGFDISRVLSDDQWCVVNVNGKPMAAINVDGMRALAVFSPRPDAGDLTEQIIRSMGDAR